LTGRSFFQGVQGPAESVRFDHFDTGIDNSSIIINQKFPAIGGPDQYDLLRATFMGDTFFRVNADVGGSEVAIAGRGLAGNPPLVVWRYAEGLTNAYAAHFNLFDTGRQMVVQMNLKEVIPPEQRFHFIRCLSEGQPVFSVRASLGWVGIGTDNPAAALDVRGTARMTVCQITSDRAAKERFIPAKPSDVLAKLVSLPISTWAYTNAPSVRHIGPIAQDFQAAFALGEDDKYIATVDADGVALASIQGLYQLVQEKDAKIYDLERRLEAMERKLDSRFVAHERP
jgi:hypothetical protein